MRPKTMPLILLLYTAADSWAENLLTVARAKGTLQFQISGLYKTSRFLKNAEDDVVGAFSWLRAERAAILEKDGIEKNTVVVLAGIQRNVAKLVKLAAKHLGFPARFIAVTPAGQKNRSFDAIKGREYLSITPALDLEDALRHILIAANIPQNEWPSQVKKYFGNK